MAQDDYYYEIQLTNKQLVFYFMAGATGLILSFLAGVMVGRGVDAAGGEVQAARPVAEDRIVTEEPPSRPAPPPAENLMYAQRLEKDKVEDALETAKPASGPKETSPPAKASAAKASPAKASPAKPVQARPAPSNPPPASAPPAPPRTAAAPATTLAARSPTAAGSLAKVSPAPKSPPTTLAASAPKAVPPAGLTLFTIQVGAFKDKGTAESVVARLKGKGFAAYVVSPEGASEGLFNVRVGSYPARTDAERVQARLRDEEKFKPFIVRE